MAQGTPISKISVVRGDELTPELTAQWDGIQEANPELASPYFCHEFTQVVASVRSDVFVGILEDAGHVVGFFPFQRGRMSLGKPVGGPVSDFHGVIAAPDTNWDVPELLRACSLTAFEFDHLLASQAPFRPFHFDRDVSHCVRLHDGFDGYAAHLRDQKSQLLKKHAQAIRRFEREYGVLRFEVHVSDTLPLRRLCGWKSAQYRRSGLVDLFGFDWTVALLERIHATQTARFAGLLSALNVDGELVAAHMGMRSRTVWHWWFPAHDVAYHRYSPGMILLLEALRAAPALGVRLLDLGKGDAFYKDRLKGDTIPLAAGRVELPSLATALRQLRRGAEAWVRRSPLLPVARVPGRLITRIERRKRFE
jgi:CelD/BcsL family acetyltransferase involved in cellulose biosynthesis